MAIEIAAGTYICLACLKEWDSLGSLVTEEHLRDWGNICPDCWGRLQDELAGPCEGCGLPREVCDTLGCA
jgi:hypothetical protein